MSALAALLLFGQAAVETGLPQRARSVQPLGSWVSDTDYPPDALARSAEGIVGFRLVVDPQGQVSDCKIERSSGDESLDAQTCAIMTSRPRFHPARNREGRPVIDVVRSRIRWQIDPNSGLVPFAPIQLVTSMTVSASGAQCSLEWNGVARPVPQCPSPSPETLAMLTSSGAVATITILVTQTPEGQTPRPQAATYGQLISESAAEFTVAPDGSLATCTMVSRIIHVASSVPTPIDLCESRFRPRFSRDDSSTSRRGAVNVSIYFARSTPG